MMRKRIYGILMATAVLSIATAGLGKANAYFTTYATATGGQIISLGDETTVREDWENDEKILIFSNGKESKEAVYVRARAYAPTEFEGELTYRGSNWTQLQDDGWCYYTKAVEPGDTLEADALYIKVKYPVDDSEGKEFNVIVVYETIPAADASYDTADWSQAKENGWTIN